jgi:hypothetical protein
MPFKDAEKRREYNRRYYHDVDKKKQLVRVKERKQRLSVSFLEWKSTKSCLHCGETDTACLEFHHVDPKTKDVEPSQMVGNRSWSFERIVKYLEETCLCLCSNCHKKVHRELRKLHRQLNEPPTRSPEREPSG